MYLKHIILLLTLVLALAAGAQAYRGGCPGQGHYQDFMSGLTPEQQQKVQALTDEHHKELFALQKELVTKHEAMENLFAASPADKAAIDNAVSEVSGLQAKKAQLNADYRVELAEIAGKPVPFESGRGCGRKGGCGAYSSGATPCAGSSPCCPPVQTM
ncbi:MAG: periplasmic heavy metal sensor [Desulfomicrobium sp.]|nr:periplasmic heavy metal sensor [Pseudomonadota bacterium]MBV1712347.1 periplasmic heavy metal sensor [Desulfomicrobium sp.]MBU4572507.1 periplasmic heavy metal sensor [Pseudomonadota bacterium]MBU4595159.1 periplasmic heavy metal sensor [Pseudomonadota bacterium]MBV1719638.1 periplasmic heavy metal sensor [Desulfomicrobium sp.]